MNYYKLIISYDGTNYQGWQQQPIVPTVSNTMIKAFKDAFHCDLTILGASRTDAGVHSLGQTALVKTELYLEPNILKNSWNKILPSDIVIIHLQKVDETFHPMVKVKEKTYYYDFFVERPLPFNQRFGLFFYWKLDIEKLKNCLNLFVGTHDFRSFCSGDEMKTTVRTINEISLQYIENLNIYRITIKGKSFLKYMIRRIVGACLEVSSRKNVSTDYLSQVLKEKDPNQTLLNAPPKGLTLYKIEYEE
ncbi:MAG: tRNA pseudouridine(38-40) synthase TruA [Candidatus Babeliales bacterium]|nr:tRNA pseudouridine(38-40) synthase TruA [Candidatus Babeliales bacterium]